MEETAEFVGALLRPHADIMKPMQGTEDGKKLVEGIFQAAKEMFQPK
jgi:hypothetical protein